MGGGWRRVFCTAIPRDREAVVTDKHQQTQRGIRNNREQDFVSDKEDSLTPPQPVTTCAKKFGLFSSISNPSTPRLTSPTLRCRINAKAETKSACTSPRGRVQCGRGVEDKKKLWSSSSSSTNTSPSRSRRRPGGGGGKIGSLSSPSSPRSTFTILKNTLGFSKSGCGVCLQSVKTGQGMAIYTAECSHSFHFPCISNRVRKQGSLICPVCNVAWKDVPLLSTAAAAQMISSFPPSKVDDVVEKTITTTSTTTSIQSSPLPTSVKPGKNNLNPGGHHETSKPYNDDEPLHSPTRFNPIPETDESDDHGEEDADDDEEFKGFIVTPTPTKNRAATHYSDYDRAQTHRNVDVKLLPESAVISVCRSHETFAVALRVKAPTLSSPSHRAPIDLVAVLDLGATMAGPKLQMLKRAMRLLISSLSGSDRLSIAAFSAEASSSQRLLPLRRMTATGQRLGRRVVDELTSDVGQGQGRGKGKKCAGEGLWIAAKVLEDRREKNPVASIILWSDGQDQEEEEGGDDGLSVNRRRRHGQGYTPPLSSTRFGHVEIPVNSLGSGSCPSSLADSFAKKLGGLLSVVVRDLRINLGFASGSAPAEIVAVYSCNGRPSLLNRRGDPSSSIRLGDLYAEEERELLVELRVPASSSAVVSRSHHVMSVRCGYKDPSTTSKELGKGVVVYGRDRALLVPRPHAVRSSDPRIERMRNVFVATKAVAEARRYVEHGEFGSAQEVLMAGRAGLGQTGSGEEYVRWIESELVEVHWMRRKREEGAGAVAVSQQMRRRVGSGWQPQGSMVDENEEPLTPTSAWRAAERLAKVAVMKKKSLNRTTSDLHGFENARF